MLTLRQWRASKALQFLTPKPALPVRRIKASPRGRVLVDDGDLSAGPDDSAQFSHGGGNVHCVFQRFRGVSAIARRWSREATRSPWPRSESSAGTRASIASARSGERYTDASGCRCLNDSREAAFAAADVGDPFAREISQMIEHDLHVQDARIDGRRIMLFVPRAASLKNARISLALAVL